MNRRQLLKLVALGGAGHILDIDRLLWVPNTKSFFFPSEVSWIHSPTISEIIAIEHLRVMANVRHLFERDETFYQLLGKYEAKIVSARGFHVPLEVKKR